MSTTSSGDDFRDLVASLLRTQYSDVDVEQRRGGTKIDITFSKHEFGSPTVFGVECKNYSKPLTKTYIAEKIFPIYEPLLNNGHIDRLLIVSQRPLNSDASAYVRDWRRVSHQTYEELAESMVGLRRYVEDLAKLRPTDDTEYVEARINSMSESALYALETWTVSSDAHGLAIWGSYGQGKSSFAKRVASLYATRYLTDPTCRLPILLKLGEVIHETQLEGLFGKEFTAKHRAPGYHFQTLEHLNREGRLLIILDGFDEMKHAMTSTDFQSNFREFNRLLVGNAKVILLGRPNALPADARDLVFRGNRRIADSFVTSSTYAPWTEWRLAFFNDTETRTLLNSTLTRLVGRYSEKKKHTYPPEFVKARMEEIFSKVPGDLLKRPVHIALIAEAGADPEFDLNDFNEFRLYEYFVNSMVARDTESKPARRHISLLARLSFQRELAWWAWSRTGAAQGSFYRAEVPTQILAELPDGNSSDMEGKRNEYIVSTLTEEKDSGVLYFAHRSFQEFLIAERVRLVAPTSAMHLSYSEFLTPDIYTFLKLAPNDDYIIGMYESLQKYQGALNLQYLKFLASFSNLQSHIRSSLSALEDSATAGVWPLILLTLGKLENTNDSMNWNELSELHVRVIQKGMSLSAAVSTMALLSHVGGTNQAVALNKVCSALINRCLEMGRPEATDSQTLSIDSKKYDFSAEWLGKYVSKRHPKHGETSSVQIVFNVNSLLSLCCKQLVGKNQPFIFGPKAVVNPFISDDDAESPTEVALDFSKILSLLPNTLRAEHLKFLSGKSIEFKIVQVERLQAKTYTAISGILRQRKLEPE